MNKIQKFGVFFVLALVLHITILTLFSTRFNNKPTVVAIKQPEIIQASILDGKKIQQEALRLKKQAKNKRLRQQQKQQKLDADIKNSRQKVRQEQQKLKALQKKTQQQAQALEQKQAAIKKQRTIEAARQAKIKKQQAIAAKKRKQAQLEKQKQQKILLAKKRKQAQIEKKKQQQILLAKKRKQAQLKKQKQRQQQILLAKKRAEAAIKQAKVDRQTTTTVLEKIRQKIENNWRRPAAWTQEMSCLVSVQLLPSGDVMKVSITKSSGNKVFDRDAVNAVRKASPVPVPKSLTLFNKNFRSFTFKFNPK